MLINWEGWVWVWGLVGGDDDDDVYLVEWVVGWRFGGEGVLKF